MEDACAAFRSGFVPIVESCSVLLVSGELKVVNHCGTIDG